MDTQLFQLISLPGRFFLKSPHFLFLACKPTPGLYSCFFRARFHVGTGFLPALSIGRLLHFAL